MQDRDVMTVVPSEVDPFAGGYPVPPLPGQSLREPDAADALAVAICHGHTRQTVLRLGAAVVQALSLIHI